MVSGFSDYRSPVGMANENCRSVLRCKSSLGNCHVVLQRYRRILDDADAVAVSHQDLVDPSQPAPSTKPPWTRTMFFMARYLLLSMMRHTSAGLAWDRATGPDLFGPNVTECSKGSLNLST